jgi:hypothetical protein
VGCRGLAARLVIHIDPSAANPVSAVADTGHPLKTFWNSTFRGGTSTDPFVYDRQGRRRRRGRHHDRSPHQGVPTLAGYFVCPSADAIRVFDRAP